MIGLSKKKPELLSAEMLRQMMIYENLVVQSEMQSVFFYFLMNFPEMPEFD